MKKVNEIILDGVSYEIEDKSAKESITALGSEVENLKDKDASLEDSINSVISTTQVLQNKFNTLNGEGEGSIKSVVEKEVKNITTVDPEVFETIESVSDWMENDTTGSAALIQEVSEISEKLDETCTVRFDRIQESEVSINTGVANVIKEIIYYKPENTFIASNGANYYDSWEGKDEYIGEDGIRKDKVYLCNGEVYIWDGNYQTLIGSKSSIIESHFSHVFEKESTIIWFNQPFSIGRLVVKAESDKPFTKYLNGNIRLSSGKYIYPTLYFKDGAGIYIYDSDEGGTLENFGFMRPEDAEGYNISFTVWSINRQYSYLYENIDLLSNDVAGLADEIGEIKTAIKSGRLSLEVKKIKDAVCDIDYKAAEDIGTLYNNRNAQINDNGGLNYTTGDDQYKCLVVEDASLYAGKSLRVFCSSYKSKKFGNGYICVDAGGEVIEQYNADSDYLVNDYVYFIVPNSTDKIYTNTIGVDLQPSATILEEELSPKANELTLSLFKSFGVIGDSYASGELWWQENGSWKFQDNYDISWGQQLGRKMGCSCSNYSFSGLTTRTWLASSNGLSKLKSEPGKDLYYLVLGLNDSYSLGIDYLGTIEDITDFDSRSEYRDTFYGNYGKIIENIKEHSPSAKIVMVTMSGDDSKKLQFNDAMIDIACHYGIPYIEQNDDLFFRSNTYSDMIYGHPTALGYSGMANAIERLMLKCIKNNYTYFRSSYSGVAASANDLTFYVGYGKNDGVNYFSSLTDCLYSIQKYDALKTVHIQEGIYDVLAELGGMDYINSKSTDTDRWEDVQPVADNVRIIGHGRVTVLFNLDVTEYKHYWLFSALNVRGDVYIENIEIQSSNCRYSIHDESGALYTHTKHEYNNVRCTQSGSAGGQTYGSGYSYYVTAKFKDCIFARKGAGNMNNSWSCHSGTGLSLSFENCIITTESSANAMRISQGGSAKIDVLVAGSYISDGITLREESNSQTAVCKTNIRIINSYYNNSVDNQYSTSDCNILEYNTNGMISILGE